MRRAPVTNRSTHGGWIIRLPLVAVFSCPLLAAEFFVAPTGVDTGPGTATEPFRTIQRAAELMGPGDTCTIRAGVYREWIKPPRGGTAEDRRITYRAAPGEKVVIKGSERITSWIRENGSLWRRDLPDSFFGGFNPYRLRLSGDWLHYGKEYHLGAIYQDGASLREKLTPAEVAAAPGGYWIEKSSGAVTLHANFGAVDPNLATTEITVRECCFFPVVSGLKYITLDGLAFEHAAANWAAWRCAQRGAVGTGWGFRWVIRNCRVAEARCVGLVCGNEASSENTGFDLRAVGGHVIRNNHILRCGQAGIHGFKGWGGSVIEGNLIEDINVHKEFGGEETAGIKLHSPIDITIRHNIVRRVHARRVPGKNNDFVAIWIDWAGQGTRVTGNVVYDNDPDTWALYLQNNHGSPILVDHNVFSGTIASNSSGCVFAHNLFDRCHWKFLKPYALVAYWKPHTAELAGCKVISYGHDRYLNNVFTGGGLERLPEGPGVQSDFNVYQGGAKPSPWDDRHSVLLPEAAAPITFVSRPGGVDLRIPHAAAARQLECPLVTRDLVGIFPLTNQGLEATDGTALKLDHDLFGTNRNDSHTFAGPFETSPASGVYHMDAGPASGTR